MFFLDVLSPGFKSGSHWWRVEREQAIPIFLSVVSSVEISYEKTNLWCIQLYFWTKNLLGYLQLPDISSFKIIAYEVHNSCDSSYCQCCH